ncbi:MAG: hypothetical protein KBB88_01625 [Candidatus Pacebacteria bacterium]|nr:hypothetical protein [Candidatus Paceibacterota bacterium]
MNKQIQSIALSTRVQSLQCGICKDNHIDVTIHQVSEMVVDPGLYDGYVADAYKMPCGHFALFSKVTKGGYKIPGILIGTLETVEPSQSKLIVIPPISPDPTHYFGEKI